MTTLLSFSRLGKLIIKQFYENSKLYLYSILAMVGLLGLIFAFWLSVDGPLYDEQATYVIFFVGLFITGTIFASLSFNMLGSKDKGIYWLGLPATHLEKLICTILFSVVLFFAFYCLAFIAVKPLAVLFLKERIKDIPGANYKQMDFFKAFNGNVWYVLYAYFAIQSLYLLGSVYFSRYSFIVTSVVTTLFFFAFVYYINKLQNGMFPNSGWDFISVRKSDEALKDGYYYYSVSPALSSFLKFIFKFAWAPLFWIVTWFRLKEKEI